MDTAPTRERDPIHSKINLLKQDKKRKKQKKKREEDEEDEEENIIYSSISFRFAIQDKHSSLHYFFHSFLF